MVYYSRYTTGKKGATLGVSLLQQVTYWPQLTTSLRLDERKHLLVYSNLCLTFLGIARISFISNQVYYLVHVYHWVIPLWFRECLHVLDMCPSSALESSISIHYPTWCHSFPSHIILNSHVTSCTNSVLLIQENVISAHAEAHFGLEVSHQWKLSASVWDFRKFFSI
jgi:hypothetical protein